MYKKQLRASIAIGTIEIITFLAIIAIHHFDTAKILFPLLWFLLVILILELGLSFVFRDTDKRWRRRWKTPLWQILLWIAFFTGGVVIIIKYPEFWDSFGAYYLFIFLIGSNYCRNIARYLIVKRYDFDKYKSVDELLSEHPEAEKYIK
ncbi:MAG: hypothetical protein IKG17_09440 [Mogibacterium sp.]|nr:hypothetical protein [Mogibacterium sp.]